MSRLSGFATTICAVAVGFLSPGSGTGLEAVRADDSAGVVRIVNHIKSSVSAPALISEPTEAKPIHATTRSRELTVTPVARHNNSHPNRLGPVQSVPATGYPQLNAPLYPSPQPWTPLHAGGTAITNQAFSPHEMQYPHRYRALYGPYYYQVRGKWFLTPLGVRSHDVWKLQGTEVDVKYRSHYRPFSFYFPPVLP